MSFSLSLRLSLCCLLTLPLTAGADPSLPRAGTIGLSLAPGITSFLPIDTPALKADLCNGSIVNYRGPISPRGECDLTVKVPSGMGILDAETPEISARNGSWQVPVYFSTLGPWKGSAPVDTECGVWDVSVDLDPDSEQPVSTLVLTQSEDVPGQGAFAGVIELAARYRFANRTRGTRLEVPARLSLDLAGLWTTLPQGTSGLADTASNISLFTLGTQGRPFSAPACGVWSDTHCAVCLTAEPPQP